MRFTLKFTYFTLFILIISGCGREYGDLQETVQIGQEIGQEALLSDLDKNTAYSICNALKSKKSNFASLPFNSHFKFNFTNSHCNGTNEKFDINTVLEVISNKFEYKPSTYNLDFISNVPVDNDSNFYSICTNPNLPNGKVPNTFPLENGKILYQFRNIGAQSEIEIYKANFDFESKKYIVTKANKLSIWTSGDKIGVTDRFEVITDCQEPSPVKNSVKIRQLAP